VTLLDQRAGDRLTCHGIELGNTNAGALGRELAGDRLADSLTASRHNRYLVR
jgi:hypothetical protein